MKTKKGQRTVSTEFADELVEQFMNVMDIADRSIGSLKKDNDMLKADREYFKRKAEKHYERFLKVDIEKHNAQFERDLTKIDVKFYQSTAIIFAFWWLFSILLYIFIG